MLSKKHNDPFYWKNRLETGDGLSGMGVIEHDALWEKLHDRLQENAAGKKALWYGIAAGLLPLIIIALLQINSSNDIQAAEVLLQQKNTGAKEVFLQPASNEAVILTVSAPVEKKQRVAVIAEKGKRKVADDTMRINENGTVVMSVPVNPATEAVTNYLQAIDTVINLSSTVTAKKKMPVVHINELETVTADFTAPVNYAQNISGKPRKNNTGNFTISAKQNSIGFKIKLSSKN